ncbi:MAG: hypothetical protein ING62_07520 [Rhodocyclaceae bacterium]|nr:hypothetical protein [Rhodocyclaceae bacterium]
MRLPTHTHLPNLFLAGDDIQNPERAYPATLEGAVRNGVSAAEQAVASISKRHRSPLRLA